MSMVLFCIGVFVVRHADKPTSVQQVNTQETFKYKIIELDSCEYIMYHGAYHTETNYIVHKGNCKYCQIRLERTLKNLK